MKLSPLAAVITLSLSQFTFAGVASAQGVPAAGQAMQPPPGQPPASPPGQPPAGQPPPVAPPLAGDPPPAFPSPTYPQFPVQPWRLPALDIPGEAKPELREEERVGDYGQPRWTANRRFPTTRIYVIPRGKAEAEYWIRYTFPTDNPTSQREVRTYYELSFGLGHRMQLDLYMVLQQEGHGDDAKIEVKREQVELRYALADWGVLWGNPTLYLEYQRRTGEHDWIEPKLLLGGQVAPGWHAGFNFVLEKELGGDKWEHEYNLTAGLSRTIIDQGFHIGVEAYAETHDIGGERFKFSKTERLFLAGPSFLIQPILPMHILISPLIGKGSGGEDPTKTMVRLWFVTGWTF